jgi:hypothetical protein
LGASSGLKRNFARNIFALKRLVLVLRFGGHDGIYRPFYGFSDFADILRNEGL